VTDNVSFKATISAVSDDGRSALARLAVIVHGKKYVVISPRAKGHVEAMNGVGRLVLGSLVKGEAVVGIEALDAINVEVVNELN
jgi:hypothetical protein